MRRAIDVVEAWRSAPNASSAVVVVYSFSTDAGNRPTPALCEYRTCAGVQIDDVGAAAAAGLTDPLVEALDEPVQRARGRRARGTRQSGAPGGRPPGRAAQRPAAMGRAHGRPAGGERHGQGGQRPASSAHPGCLTHRPAESCGAGLPTRIGDGYGQGCGSSRRRPRMGAGSEPVRGRPGAGPGSRRRRSSSVAAASPAASTRSGRCGRSTCCRSTGGVTDFDIYVGTSAGSLVASALFQRRLARGDDAGDRRRAADAVRRSTSRLGSPQLPRIRQARAGVPVADGASDRRRWPGTSARSRPVDLGLGLAEMLPDRPLLRQGDRALRPHDPVGSPAAATTSGELEKGAVPGGHRSGHLQRVVFGRAGFDDVPISAAVSASSALPMIYTPVRIGDREYVDGGIVSTTNLDIAVNGGRGSSTSSIRQRHRRTSSTAKPDADPDRASRRCRLGDPHHRLPGVRPARPSAASRRRPRSGKIYYPGVDIILIEPESSDELMFQTSGQ